MNRVKKSKIQKKKKMKEIILGLSLAIFIGISGSVGSYAYFSAKAYVDSGIIITTGTLGSSMVGEKDNVNDNNNNKHVDDPFNISSKFTIKNEGSLNQLITLNLSIEESINIESKNIEYNITIKDENDNIVSVHNSIEELRKKQHELDTDNSLTCTVEIINSKDIIINKDEGASIKFKLESKGTQVNQI